MSTFCKPMIPEAVQKNSSDTIIDLPQAAEDHFGLGSVKNATCSKCKMEAVIKQFFSGPELAKMFCQVAFAAIFATPVTYKNQMLPVDYCLAISLLLFLGFLGLFTAIAVQKAFPYVADVLVLAGTACVVSTVPIVTAGVLPDHRLFLWAFFALFLLFIFLGFVWLHRHVFKQTLLDLGEIAGESSAKEEIQPFVKLNLPSEVDTEEVGKFPIPSCTNEQGSSEAPRAIAVSVKLDSEDVKEEVQFWNSAVACYVIDTNPPFKVMEGFFRRAWGKHGIDKISKLPNGLFIVRFNARSQALKVTAEKLMFDGKLVITKLWEPGLNLKRWEISATVPVWIQFPRLDLKYWNSNCLYKLAGLVGNPIKLDRVTSHKERLNFARILVQVKVNHQLPDWIYFEDEAGVQRAQKVDYEWKPPLFCDSSEHLGHRFTDYCRTREFAGKKVWVVKSSGSVAAGNN